VQLRVCVFVLQEMSEQLECLQMMNNTLSQSFHDMEKDTQALKAKNKVPLIGVLLPYY
jgi:hypothetical protein